MKPITRLEDLTPDPKNPNKHTRRGTRLLERSLRELGAGRGVAVSADAVVLAGNATVEEAVALGFKARVVETDGSELVVVQRTDMLSGSPEARALAIADNYIGQANLDWDTDVLSEIRAGQAIAPWFDKADADALLGMQAEPDPTRDVVADAIATQAADAVAERPGGMRRPAITLVFRDRAEANAAASTLGLDPDDKYVSGPAFSEALMERVRGKA